MSYQIIEKEAVDDTIYTVVQYTINGQILAPIRIPHFMPNSVEEILIGIQNREASEQRRIEAIERNLTLIQEL